MSDFKESGTITKVGEVQTFDSGFQKREFVIQTYGDYPQDIKFELLKDNVDKVKESHLNHAVDVHFNLRGQKWKDRYFVNLVAWKVVDLTKQAEHPTMEKAELQKDVEQEDLPF